MSEWIHNHLEFPGCWLAPETEDSFSAFHSYLSASSIALCQSARPVNSSSPSIWLQNQSHRLHLCINNCLCKWLYQTIHISELTSIYVLWNVRHEFHATLLEPLTFTQGGGVLWSPSCQLSFLRMIPLPSSITFAIVLPEQWESCCRLNDTIYCLPAAPLILSMVHNMLRYWKSDFMTLKYIMTV